MENKNIDPKLLKRIPNILSILNIKPLYDDKQSDLEIKESELLEDEDLLIVPELEEKLPLCDNLKELEAFILISDIIRNIEYLTIHCTATQENATVTAIERYWREVLKWKSPGYHIIVNRDGKFTVLADFNRVTNGVKGFNLNSIHISYIGGINKYGKPVDNLSEKQFKTIDFAIKILSEKLPNIKIQGHRDFPKVAKACPCFNTKEKFNI